MTHSRTFLLALLALGLYACEEPARPVNSTGIQVEDMTQLQNALGIEQLKRQLQETPYDFTSLSRLADLYFESGQYLLAIQHYERALEVDPQCADCLNDKGLAQFYLGDAEGALVSLEAANRVDPNYPNAWLSRGYVLFSIGRYEDAVEPLQQARQKDVSGALTPDANKFLGMIEQQRSQAQ